MLLNRVAKFVHKFVNGINGYVSQVSPGIAPGDTWLSEKSDFLDQKSQGVEHLQSTKSRFETLPAWIYRLAITHKRPKQLMPCTYRLQVFNAH